MALAAVNAAGFAWLLNKRFAEAKQETAKLMDEKLNTLFADAKQETAKMMDKKLGPIGKNVAALVAVAGHDTVAPRGSPERPRGAVASSIAGLAELIQPRDSGPIDTARVVATLCADLAPQAWRFTLAALDELAVSAAAALAKDEDARRARVVPLNAALVALQSAAQPDWLAADVLARQLCAAFQAAERLGASSDAELRAAVTIRTFAERASAASDDADLGGVLAAMDSDAAQPTLPFWLLLWHLTGNASWQELEFDGIGPATLRNRVLTLRLHESKSSADEGACLSAPVWRRAAATDTQHLTPTRAAGIAVVQLETRACVLATVADAAVRVAGSPLAQLQRVEVQAGVITTTPLRQQQARALSVHALPRRLAVSGALPAITDPAAPRADDGSFWAR